MKISPGDRVVILPDSDSGSAEVGTFESFTPDFRRVFVRKDQNNVYYFDVEEAKNRLKKVLKENPRFDHYSPVFDIGDHVVCVKTHQRNPSRHGWAGEFGEIVKFVPGKGGGFRIRLTGGSLLRGCGGRRFVSFSPETVSLPSILEVQDVEEVKAPWNPYDTEQWDIVEISPAFAAPESVKRLEGKIGVVQDLHYDELVVRYGEGSDDVITVGSHHVITTEVPSGKTLDEKRRNALVGMQRMLNNRAEAKEIARRNRKAMRRQKVKNFFKTTAKVSAILAGLGALAGGTVLSVMSLF